MGNKKTVLWIVNMVMPDLANHLEIKTGTSGTWMIDLSHRLVDGGYCNLAIACIYGTELKKYEVNGITYYTLPGKPYNMYMYTRRYEDVWKKINDELNADLVHLHGTEYSHGLSFLRACPHVPALLTIQGVMCKISEAAFDGISIQQAIFSNTAREWIHFSGMYMNNLLRKKNLKYEREMIQRVSYVTGRTDWDKAILESINPDIHYYRVFYNLRDEFYTSRKWNVQSAEKHTIYASTSAQAVLKGGHVLLKALALVKKKYPDVKAVFLLQNADDGKFRINNGYGKIIHKLIQDFSLEENVLFIPPQNTSGVISNMLRCHCAVIPSAMENASATLREAMHLGVPCIASYRGGMAELIDEGNDGMLYDFEEYEVLADKICRIFSDDAFAAHLSSGAVSKAEKWHDRTRNTDDLDAVYREVLR